MPAHSVATATAALLDEHRPADDVFYPSSDGKPMAENMWQARAIVNAASDIAVARPDALIAPDIFVYPQRGNPRNRIAPDVLVAFGLGTHSRSSYKVWEEGKPPDWVLEVASPSTSANDLDGKRRDYAAMGVPEYWLFDPKGDQFPPGMPRLQGLRLTAGTYRPLAARLADGKRVVRSEVLALEVRVEGELLRFRDPSSGTDVRHHAESEAAALREADLRRGAEAEAEQATARARAAEARIAALEAALGRTGADRTQ